MRIVLNQTKGKTLLNLIDDPWIDTLDGGKLSIRDTLLRSAAITGLYGGSPLETFSLLRFLGVIAQAIHANDFDVLQRGSLDAVAINHFCDTTPMCVSGDAPFAQVKGLMGELKSIGYLTPDLPTGSNPIWFDHKAQDDEKAYCSACVARGLISISAWQTIGGAGLTASINGAPPVYVLPKTRNLFETLALLIAIPLGKDQGLGDPLWGRPLARAAYVDVGLWHGLTFMPRLILVEWRHSKRLCTRCGAECATWASEMIHKAGEAYRGDKWQDPCAFYNPDKDGKRLYSVKANAWHNDQKYTLERLLAAKHRPAIMGQWPEHKNWLAYGAVTDQAKWFDCWVTEFSVA